MQLQDLLCCIGLINDIFIEIQKLWNNEAHWIQFNGWKNIYAMNNMVNFYHHGLFMYVNVNYFEYYHDMTILWHSNIYQGWCHYFIHGDNYFEYDLGNPNTWVKICSLCVGQGDKLAPHANHDVVQTFNKMHVAFKVQVEWGIGGLKRKWRCFMKRFD